jgi:hypothetical protein
MGRHQVVTSPYSEQSMSIPYSNYQWEIFEPRIGDSVEFLHPKGGFSVGNRATIQRVQGENIYFTLDTKTLAGKKGQKESAATKFDVKLISRD